MFDSLVENNRLIQNSFHEILDKELRDGSYGDYDLLLQDAKNIQ